MGIGSHNGRYCLEVPMRLLDKDLLITPTILSTSARTGNALKEKYGYAGDRFPGSLIRFHKSGNQVLEILLPPTKERLIITDREAKKLWNYVYDMPVLLQLHIVNQTDSSYIIDVDDFLNGRQSLFSLTDFAIDLGIDQLENSQIIGFYGTSKHIEIRYRQTYKISSYVDKVGQGMRDFEIAFAISKLNDSPLEFKQKVNDIGYFGLPYKRIDNILKGSERCMIAQRWRLEPLTTNSYDKDILIQPIKPILFYIDPNTPHFLKPYFKEAVEMWEPVFCSAGFEKAITALTENDSLISLGDPNISFISYKPSKYRNAYGPRNLDPRSGEIISSNVGIFHDIISLVEEYYFVNCLMLDHRCSYKTFPDSLTGELMKLVVAHEIGHSLGLEHNFGGSAARTINNLKNRDYLNQWGISNSIMDYVRFNYVATPEDSILLSDLIARTGCYDHFAIAWGYNPRGEIVEKNILKSSIASQQDKEERCMFISEDSYQDSRAQSNDLSNNPIEASRYGLEKIRYALSFLRQDTLNKDLATKRYDALFNWYQLFIGHVVKHIGSSGLETANNGQRRIQVVSFQEQLKALDFLDHSIFKTPSWLIHSDFASSEVLKTKDRLKQLTKLTLSDLLQRYSLVIDYERDNIEKDYSSFQLLQAINNCIFNDWKKSSILSAERRHIQMIHLNNLCAMIQNESMVHIAHIVQIRTELERIQRLAKKMNRITKDKENKLFFMKVVRLIAKVQ